MARYVELHSHSYYSLLDGASAPADLIPRAAELGMTALALTDHDAVYGAVPFLKAAHTNGIKPILGTEITLENGHHLTLLVKNLTGWHNLCQIISLARHNAPKGAGALAVDALLNHKEGIIALSGCRNGEIAQALLHKRPEAALATAQRYRDWFAPGNFWIELQNHLLPQDGDLNDALVALARRLSLGYVATNNVHYAQPERHRLQDVLVCIRHRTTLAESHHLRRPNSEYYLKSAEEMAALFADYPEALDNTLRIADQCQFELRSGLQDLPTFPTPSSLSPADYLRQLCEAEFYNRYRSPSEAAQALLRHELSVIDHNGLSNYFLIVWDIVRFARENDIRCQGRGSAANSLVAYLLGISPVDPLVHHLVFERFLSEERVSVPDIDIDFQADRREEIIQYVYQRYGAAYTAMACTFITFRTRSAIRDVGKALGYAPVLLDQLVIKSDVDGAKVPQHAQLWELCGQIDGFPRHLGIHNGGMVITGVPMSQRVPTEPATMPDRVVVQWDKDMLETAGMVKIDILGLRMLSAIAEAVNLVEHTSGQRPDLTKMTFDDPALYRMMTDADTVGVFQVESRAQAQVLPRLRPKTFNDVIVSISLIRPGPVMGNMVHPYLRRRTGHELVSYPHELLESALEETLGVILFQEQVLKVARDLAGFTAGQGEQLRRALGNKRAHDAIEAFQQAFIEGAVENDVLAPVAEDVFSSLKAFGGYSFPKSHAAAFAVLVYQSAWLKHYHPAAFYTALLNNQPMGFWSPAVIVNDARRHGILIRRVDIHRSRSKCSVEDNAIRLGFNYVSGMGEAKAKQLETARAEGWFADLADFVQRTHLPRRIVENLIQVGAMDDWGIPRRKLLWELGQINDHADGLHLKFEDEGVELDAISPAETLAAEREILGLLTDQHVMTHYRDWMQRHGILGSRELSQRRDGQMVRIAGQNVMHQAPPTAKGFHFITLEDEEGFMNVIVRPHVYARYRKPIRHLPLLMVEGKVQREGAVTNVICHKASMLHI